MDVKVAFYGDLVRLAGARTRTVRVSGDPPTVGDLRIAIGLEWPEMVPRLYHSAVGIGTEILPDDAVLHAEEEISLLPPVSGGLGEEGPDSARTGDGRKDSDPPRIVDGPLSLDDLLAETGGVDSGALAVFAGTIRARDDGREVAALDYDVHRDMAERTLRRIESEIESSQGVLACRITHRVGLVPAGEASVYVVVRARHRAEAFVAVRDGIDRVKREAPIWKEEVAPDGNRRPHSCSDETPLKPSRQPPGRLSADPR